MTPQGTKQPDIPTHHHLFPAPGLIEGSPPPVHRLCADLDERTLQEESQGDGARQTDKGWSKPPDRLSYTARSIVEVEPMIHPFPNL
ncbi:unnamed protein product [Caretta caretta]